MEIRSFTFDDINSLDYGVYITGSGVYDAPERDVDVISIPGRNGDLYLDNGRFNNIDVTYPASMGRMSQNDFSEKMQEFRNALLSKTGYCRLYDSYNPDEFRLGVYKSGLNVSPNKQNRAGEFDITFNCKPQRFLKVGEQSVAVEDGDTIVNPTPFPSSPLLEVEGYGDITVNGSNVNIEDSPIGELTLGSGVSRTNSTSGLRVGAVYVHLNAYSGLYYNGDICTNRYIFDSLSFYPVRRSSGDLIQTYSIVQSTSGYSTALSLDAGNTRVRVSIELSEPWEFVMGTASNNDYSCEIELEYVDTFSQTHTETYYISIGVSFNGSNMITIGQTTMQNSSGPLGNSITDPVWTEYEKALGDVTIYSTYSALGNPLYLDFENGEAYKYENGEYVSVNNAVWLGTELPVLESGGNEITYDSNVHALSVVPRWWII